MLNDRSKLVTAKTLGVDSRVDEILNNPEGELACLYKRAEALYKSKLKKSYVESGLLHTPNPTAVAEVLEIDQRVLTIYYEFFFEIDDWDRLSKIEHIDQLKRLGRDWSTNEALLKMWTLTQGLDFLAWRLGKSISISPIDGLVDLFSTCMFKSKEAMFNPSVSDTSKESTKWVKLSTDIARLLKLWVMDSSAARKDLEIAIREVVPEFGGLESLINGTIDFETHLEVFPGLADILEDNKE